METQPPSKPHRHTRTQALQMESWEIRRERMRAPIYLQHCFCPGYHLLEHNTWGIFGWTWIEWELFLWSSYCHGPILITWRYKTGLSVFLAQRKSDPTEVLLINHHFKYMPFEAYFDKSKTEMALLGASTLSRFVTSILADGLEKNAVETQFHNMPYCWKKWKTTWEVSGWMRGRAGSGKVPFFSIVYGRTREYGLRISGCEISTWRSCQVV